MTNQELNTFREALRCLSFNGTTLKKFAQKSI